MFHNLSNDKSMKTLQWLLVFATIQLVNSQSLKRQTLASAGNSQPVQTSTGSYFLLQSIGQLGVINTFEANENELRQGFVQPLPAIVLGGDPNDLEILVYPNPFVDGVIVNLENGLEGEIQMQLFDISGRLVVADSFGQTSQLSIPLTNLSQGSYFMRLSAGGQQRVTQLLKL
ncbi:Hypothetical protein I595_276 [Croceitalea dokdonensis DOKDO 023]|uniref:Secretion system C-terminal sorting domain-containing protein n=2 Tax=Croceitalea TaxID=574891 RepID=A0A0P7AYQ5_9FLAO|nr:Hypothetical protein I595_276 [Croceitalea dokdonensis DOKDO 023]